MSPRVLITGGSGFVGQWLSRALLERGWTVTAGSIDGAPRNGVLSEEEIGAIEWEPLDVTSDAQIANVLDSSKPDFIVHLAAIAFTPDANASPAKAFDVNALGALRLLSAVDRSGGRPRVLVIGSAEEYGPHAAAEYPLRESTPLQPLTPYGASKAAQELIALQICRGSGVPVICTRSFNHSGVGHGSQYLLPKLVRSARDLPKSGGVLSIGNETSIRDFLHVTDVVDAYVLLLERGEPGEVYNVSSGTGRTIREIAGHVLNRLGTSADISSDASLIRKNDMAILIGDSSKLRRATGWKPKRSIDDIIDDLIHAATR
jgi:GDP-4-dehydro-6-deoxy-D-mannose reductase